MDSLDPIVIDETSFLKTHCTLPPLPEAVTRIQSIIHSDNVSINEISKIIGSDPSLSAQVLKIVNSAYYGLPREVNEVKFAVAYLGIHEIYNAVLTVAVIDNIKSEDKKEIEAIRYHSIYTALCTISLAKKLEPLLAPENFWAPCVLHDIGKLIYLKFFPQHYRVLVNHQKKTGCLFSEAEKHFSVPKSSYLGALLCKNWRLPQNIRDACKTHTLDAYEKDESMGSRRDFIKMICAGNLIAILATDNLDVPVKQNIISRLSLNIGLPEEDFLSIMGEAYDLRDEVDKYFW